VTIRRACAALHFDRSTYHYQSRRTDPAFLKKRIKEICETHVRYGYRRVYSRFSYRGEDVVATLDKACRKIGYPKTIRVDNGSEFISRDMDLWAYQRGVTLDFSRPGKPTDNAFIEAFNSKLDTRNNRGFGDVIGRGAA
jgi:hypothetical protein